MDTSTFFSSLWESYIQVTPQAEQIRQEFLKTDDVVNDHVAFRTFAGTPLSLAKLEPLILSMGYELQGEYDFSEKKLRARSYIHSDDLTPKIFLSELLVDELSAHTAQIIGQYTDQIRDQSPDLSVFWSGRHWTMPTWSDYKRVQEESEYGAWLLALGLVVNHFTVSVNHLGTTQDLGEVLARVKAAGHELNKSGGLIKGSPAEKLEQGSTMADRQKICFDGGKLHEIPTCFYEFAKRYPDENGTLYQGFIAANADKIFESTHSG